MQSINNQLRCNEKYCSVNVTKKKKNHNLRDNLIYNRYKTNNYVKINFYIYLWNEL